REPQVGADIRAHAAGILCRTSQPGTRKRSVPDHWRAERLWVPSGGVPGIYGRIGPRHRGFRTFPAGTGMGSEAAGSVNGPRDYGKNRETPVLEKEWNKDIAFCREPC